jgi:hypothetical protein
MRESCSRGRRRRLYFSKKSPRGPKVKIPTSRKGREKWGTPAVPLLAVTNLQLLLVGVVELGVGYGLAAGDGEVGDVG